MLSIDFSVIVVFAIVWILVLVLNRVYFRPVGRVMKDRDVKLRQDLDSAQAALEKTGNILDKIEGEMKETKTKAREIREKFDREAQKEKEKMIEEVSQECRAQVELARKELDEKVEKLKKELEPQNQEFAEKITIRLLN